MFLCLSRSTNYMAKQVLFTWSFSLFIYISTIMMRSLMIYIQYKTLGLISTFSKSYAKVIVGVDMYGGC
ncbi:hypothetical protein RchiOBHm_Chr2g0152341 [Rosa chinensis]|uniref:Uncharacterized protein n=1 Tax=Rosa chinensis TaxID=74649 RepID=A0A2P6S0D9_ROSCH|nr:hypothetical protein RchiOBHm_Chr2g0152341 [Rosa chinensis]